MTRKGAVKSKSDEKGTGSRPGKKTGCTSRAAGTEGTEGMVVLQTNSVSQTMALGEILGRGAEPGDIFCVSGGLGAGKTVLAKGVARGLGVKEEITSPTFTLINEYQGRLPFYHFDVYRLKGSQEMSCLGYEEYFYGPGVTLVEWADRVAEVLPAQRLEIRLETVLDDEKARVVTFLPRGARYRRLVKETVSRAGSGD
ncbi:MAG: tRNA (adenosine(37)-N6)-threonylcarbamoyltransferase complex ATPase subunit type 1 TsaE [Desulfotomaculales bacterium]